MDAPLNVAIVGCGNISRGYATTMGIQQGKVRLAGAYDTARDRSEALTKEFGGRAYASMDELLGDPSVCAVVNLTTYQLHGEVTARCLRAGKHVHSEKPLSTDTIEAQQLVMLAQEKNLRLSVAPSTFLGEAQQTAWRVIRQGQLGTVRVAYAEMNHGRIESWHPQPQSFYRVGPLFDVGVYPLSVLTTILGPVRTVHGYTKIVWPQRHDKAGEAFDVEAPDWGTGVLEFESGTIARLTTTFYVGPTKQTGMEFHGDVASLHVSDAAKSDASVQIRPFEKWEWDDVPLVRDPFPGIEWGRGVSELADAIREQRPHRVTGAQGAHVVEIINGILRSADTHQPVQVESCFTPIAPMEWSV
jgi:predicted dehydrogenase